MQPRLIKDWSVRFPWAWLINESKNHAKAKNVFVTGKDCAKPKKDNLAKHEISANHRRSTLLPKRQMDFVTANDHVKSAIIAHMWTALVQAKHCLLIVKNAFIRGSLQDLDSEGAASRIHWFSETGGHCRRDQSSGGGHLGQHLYGDVLCVGDLQCDRFSCFIFLIKRWCYVFL